MKFKVGDRVKVKEDIIKPEQYDDITEEMYEFAGQIATITGIDSGSNISLDIDKGHWLWYEDTLEPFNEKW